MIERSFTTIDLGQVHLRSAGAHHGGRPIILLHASPASSKSFTPLLEQLGQTRHVIAPDTLGNGESPPPGIADPDIGYYADAMQQAMRGLGHDRVDVYGTHTGAHIGIEWAIRHPDMVQSLTLEGLAHFSATQRQEFLDHYAPPKSPDATGSQFHWAWQFIRDQMIFFPYYRRDAEHLRTGGSFDADVLHQLVMDVLNCLETYHLPYQAVFQHDLANRLPLVPVSTLCLVSNDGHMDDGIRLAMTAINTIAKKSVTDTPARAAAISAFTDQISGVSS